MTLFLQIEPIKSSYFNQRKRFMLLAYGKTRQQKPGLETRTGRNSSIKRTLWCTRVFPGAAAGPGRRRASLSAASESY